MKSFHLMIGGGLQYLNINRHYSICNAFIALCVPSPKDQMDSHIFSPHFQSFLLPYFFHSTLLLPSLVQLSIIHPPCPGIIPAVPSRDSFPYRQNEISQSSLPPSCTCTRERCIRNISAYTRAWGTT